MKEHPSGKNLELTNPVAVFYAYSQREVEIFAKAQDVLLDIEEFYQRFRSIMKHGDEKDQNIDKIWDLFIEHLGDHIF